jgi:hypothetical protein
MPSIKRLHPQSNLLALSGLCQCPKAAIVDLALRPSIGNPQEVVVPVVPVKIVPGDNWLSLPFSQAVETAFPFISHAAANEFRFTEPQRPDAGASGDK